MSTEPKQLPKALSEREREYVGHHALAAGQRALALIDALTATMAEQAAQIVTDGQRIAELEARLLAHEAGVFQHAGQRIAELEAERDAALEGEADAVAACDANWVQHQRIVAAEQKLAAANVLLGECVKHGLRIGAAQLLKRIRAHLAGQPAAPSRAQMPGDWSDADCNDLRKPLPAAPSCTEAFVFPGSPADRRARTEAELARRGLK